MCAVQGHRKAAYLYIQKRHFVKNVSCGYKMVTVIRLRLTAAAIGVKMGTVKGGRASRREAGSLSEAGSPYFEN